MCVPYSRFCVYKQVGERVKKSTINRVCLCVYMPARVRTFVVLNLACDMTGEVSSVNICIYLSAL